MDSKKLALLCRDLAENKKAENIVVLDVRKVSTVTDFFVIASGSTEPHIKAIVSEITDRLRSDYKIRPNSVDGEITTPWQVIDYFDVIVHIMRPDIRQKYDLESLWGDAAKVDTKKTVAKKAVKKTTKPRKAPSKAKKKSV